MKLKASESGTTKQVNQLNKSEQMAVDINNSKEYIYKALKEFNSTNMSINNILERVSYMKDKDIKKGVFNESIPSGVYNSGATSSCG